MQSRIIAILMLTGALTVAAAAVPPSAPTYGVRLEEEPIPRDHQ